MRAGKERVRDGDQEVAQCTLCRDCALCRSDVNVVVVAAQPGGQPSQTSGDGERNGKVVPIAKKKRQRRGQRLVWHGGTCNVVAGLERRSQGYLYPRPALYSPSTAVGVQRMEQQQPPSQCTIFESPTTISISTPLINTTPSRSRSPWPLLSLLSFLPFLPLASAVPAPTRTSPLPKRTLATEVPVLPPSGILPTSITPVKETALPYRLKFDETEGQWTPVEGWVRFGRGFDRSADDVFVNDSFAADPPQWAVSEVLPRGWGQTSDRSSLYKTPLIAVSSVILAGLIVTCLLVIFISQRKTHRKALRRRTKDRAKALKAAGIAIDTTDPRAVDALYHEKIEAKPKAEGRKAITTAKKVGKWRKGLRRRKLGGDDSREQVVVVENDSSQSGGDGSVRARAESGEMDVPRVQTEFGEGSSAVPPGTTSSEEAASGELTDQPTGDTAASTVAASGPSVVLPSGNHPHFFPPAYRPASVTSLYTPEVPRVNDTEQGVSGSSTPPPPLAASSSAAAESSPVLSARAQEKSPATYYPAPTTVEAEQALAVAQAADSGHATEALTGNEEVTAHVATDDKQLLERLRVRGSAPPVSSSVPGDGLATAPTVEVDEDGYERYNAHEGSSEPPHEPIAQPSSSIPLPPRPTVQRSLQNFSPVSPAEMPVLAPALMPSAPPPTSEAIMPSAPTLEDEPATEDEVDDLEYSSPPRPSMPRLPSSDADHSTEEQASDIADNAAHQARVGAAPETGAKVTFLPKYEP